MLARAGRPTCRAALILAGVLSCVAHRGDAAIYYVDNRRGSDSFDGHTSYPVSDLNGPLRTIRRALELAAAGDTIVLTNNEIPYNEPLQLVGARHSGFEHAWFTIVGNGSVIDGTRPVPPDAWKEVGNSLWRLRPYRKGAYQLLLRHALVPELRLDSAAEALPAIPQGQWCAYKGSVFYQAAPFESPPRLPFRIAYHDVGLSLYRVHNVQVFDLTIRNFRLDGMNSPDLCRQILLENVTVSGSGRAGIAVGGTSELVLRNCRFQDNRGQDILKRDFGSVQVDDAGADEAAGPAK